MLEKILLSVLLLCLPLAAWSAPTILVYGDSLSAAYGIPVDRGWAHLLQQRLAKHGFPHNVANASISGETSSGGLARIEQALREHRPQLLILELGANDGLRGLPLEQMRDNLAAIIETCQRQRVQVVLAGMRLPPNYGPRYASAFADSYAALAQRYRLALLPFFLEGIAGRRHLLQEDGLHPTAEAQPILLDNVWQALLPLLQGHQAGTAKRAATR